MIERLHAVVAHAAFVPADERARFARQIRTSPPPGAVVVETCHRVEVHAAGSDPAEMLDELPDGVRRLHDRDVADHVVALAVGLRSAIVAENELLHQLRTSVDEARSRGRLPAELDRLFDHALRAGRRGRSWLPARRPSLGDAALDLAPQPLSGRTVVVIGTGPMGRLAVAGAVRRGARIVVASRTRERADAVAADHHATVAELDPGPLVGEAAAIVVALAGPWTIGPETAAALLDGRAHVVDLSAPPATPAAVRVALGPRFVSIDDLAVRTTPIGDERLVGRLRDLAAATVDEYVDWLARDADRAAARTMAERAETARSIELGELWRRLPHLEAAERSEIERMSRHLAERLLREPLARLGDDSDGRREQAARELFGL